MKISEKVMTRRIDRYDDWSGKKIIVRIDTNVSLGENGVVDDAEAWRLEKSLKTIRFLADAGACVVVLGHIGRDGTQSLKPVHQYMTKKIQMGFGDLQNIDLTARAVRHMANGSVVMIENLRQSIDEKNNDLSFLQALITECDGYVNEAFSVSHRMHASVAAITEVLPSYFGFQFYDEVSHLEQLFDTDHRRTVLVLGGAKFGTKLDLLESMVQDVDFVLVGGALAHPFLQAAGINIGKSFTDDSVNISKISAYEKIILPVDCVDQDGDVVSINEIRGDDMILDIGPETEKLFETIIDSADVIIWNGPMGKYEDGYIAGSQELAKSISHAKGVSMTGGGDTATVILESGLGDSFDFVSTGGGAMLDFLVHKTLPGIELLLENNI
jgi:phosphoglycerate kinase